MSAGAGFGSDGGGDGSDAAMARATGESPRGRIHIPIHRGIDARAPRRATIMQGRKEYMDRRCSEHWTPRSDRRGIFHTFRSPEGEGGWETVIDSGFKTLPTGRKSTRKKGRCFQLPRPVALPAPLAAADQDALRRSRNDRYFEPLLILPLRENSDGGGGGAVRAR